MAKVDLRKLGVVFRREYLERVRSKWFLIGTLLGPVFLEVIRVLPAYISMKQGPGNALTNVVVLDTTGTGLGARVGSALAKSFPAVPSPRVKLVTPERLAVAEDSAVNAVNAVIRKDINGLLVLDSNTVANGSVRYAGRNASSISDMQTLMSSVKQMGRASVVGQPVHLLSPLVPSTSLLVGLVGVGFDEHQRFTIEGWL